MKLERTVSQSSIVLLLSALLQSSSNETWAQNYGNSHFRSYVPGMTGQSTQQNEMYNGFSALAPAQSTSRQLPPQRHTSPQNRNGASLENTLDAIDTKAGWDRTPVSNQYAPGTIPYNQRPPVNMPSNQGLFPGISRQEKMRIFMEGGTPSSPMPQQAAPTQAPTGENASMAYSNYQRARNEENKSRYEANNARYGKDKWTRKNAASNAEYAADNANYAAQRAETAGYNGGSEAQRYANLARQCANRARNSANQARYNANTMP